MMTSRRFLPVLVALLLGMGAQGAHAQIGAIVDWITKMSGPGVVRIGPQFTTALGGGARSPELSAAAMYGFKVRDGDGPDGAAGLTTITGQVTLGVPIVFLSPDVALLGVGGVAGHLFNGEGSDNFGVFSFPLQGAIRIRAGARSTIRVGAGVNLFRFPDDAFDGLDVGVEPGEWEAAFGTQVSFIIDI